MFAAGAGQSSDDAEDGASSVTPSAKALRAVSFLRRETISNSSFFFPTTVNGLQRGANQKLTERHFGQDAQSFKRRRRSAFAKVQTRAAAPIALAEKLQALGMKSAFDIPQGSANFDKMAPRKPNDYLYISNVFRQTFIAI